jgi:hypothetical protein
MLDRGGLRAFQFWSIQRKPRRQLAREDFRPRQQASCRRQDQPCTRSGRDELIRTHDLSINGFQVWAAAFADDPSKYESGKRSGLDSAGTADCPPCCYRLLLPEGGSRTRSLPAWKAATDSEPRLDVVGQDPC